MKNIDTVIQEFLLAFGVSVTMPVILDFTAHLFSVMIVSIVGTTTIHFTRKFLNRNENNKNKTKDGTKSSRS